MYLGLAIDMNLPPIYLRSLFLTSLVSFLTPLLFAGSAITGLIFMGLIPGLDGFSQWSSGLILTVLRTLGSGKALEGSLVIGGACGVVGALFNTYIFYRYSSFRRD